MERPAYHVSDSRTTQVQIVMSEHINGAGRLFGGKLMEWIDVVAGVTARRHCRRNVTTACIDGLSFESPAYLNDTLVLVGQVTYVGTTSMEVRVDTFVESLNGARVLVNRAYLVMVAMREDGSLAVVPKLICDTEEERQEEQAATARRALRRPRPKHPSLPHQQ